MKFFSRRRFNYLDIIGISWGVQLINQGHTGWAAAVLVGFLLGSCIAEAVWGS